MSAQLQQGAVAIQSRVPWDEYTQLPGTSISRLKELRRSAQHYLYRLTVPKESAALQLGKAAHAAVLEPERFEREYFVWRRRSEKTGNLCPRNGQFYDAFLAEHHCTDEQVITEDEHAVAVAIQSAVRGNPSAMRYLAAGDPEVTLQWVHDGRPCRGRVDWLTTVDGVPHLVGLKTSRDCRHMKFGYQAAVLGYHLQWGFYFDGYTAIKGREPRMIEIVVESEAPHAVAVYFIPHDIVDQGRDEYQALLLRLAEHESTGHFPGPQEHEEPLSLPSWVYGDETDDIGDLGLEE